VCPKKLNGFAYAQNAKRLYQLTAFLGESDFVGPEANSGMPFFDGAPVAGPDRGEELAGGGDAGEKWLNQIFGDWKEIACISLINIEVLQIIDFPM
jgi:hypothetical protein